MIGVLATEAFDLAGDVIVIGNGAPEFTDAVARCRPDQTVIDLVRIPIDFSTLQAQYDGICW